MGLALSKTTLNVFLYEIRVYVYCRCKDIVYAFIKETYMEQSN